MRISGIGTDHIHLDARTARPRLDWGPFSVGCFVSLVFAFLAGADVYVALTHSLWWLLAEIVWVPGWAICLASSIGVLTKPRRIASQRERDAYRAQHGSLD